MSELTALVRGVMALDPAAPAIEFKERWYSWGQLTRIIAAIDTTLEAHDIPTGARVGGLLHNAPPIAALIVALITGDRCVVTLNPALPEDKLAADIKALRIPVLVGLAQDWERPAIRAAAEEAGVLGLAIDADEPDPVRVVMPRRSADHRVDAEGIAIEMLTSGTTGTPKRVPLKASHFGRMIIEAALFESRTTDRPTLRPGVSILNTPFSHIGGIFGLFNWLTAGRKACMLERFQVGPFVDAVSRHRPKTAGAPPAALRMLLDANVPREKLSSLVAFRASTAPLDPDLADAFYERFGIPVLQNYGATEFAGGVAGWTLADFKALGAVKRGSVGKMMPGVDGRIVNADDGRDVPFGEPGLLELRARHLGDGRSWMRTTDIARMDADGFLWILGRADNAIIRGGFKVIPDDVVRAIEAHPAVLEAAVTALPDPRLGAVPVAAYRCRAGSDVEEEALREFLRERLAPYQVPVRLRKLDDLPRTPSMKVSQPELRKLFEQA